MDEREAPARDEQVDTRPEAIAHVDLDGTLADFDGAMERDMRLIASPDEIAAGTHYFREQEGEPEHIRNRRRLIKRQPGWWAGLEPIELGMAVFEQLQRLRYQISILTKAPIHNDAAWGEKVQWCKKHLPMFEGLGIGMGIVTDKSRVYGRVLFDDWPKYIEPWLKHRPRGLVLMLAQPWNEGFGVGRKNIIRVTPKTLGQAFEALAQMRETCQP